MSTLQIFREGHLHYELELEQNREYIAGRSSQCDIILDGSPEISRSHLKIYFSEVNWWVEVLSRFGELYTHDPNLDRNEKVEKIELKNGVEFSVPPFNFKLIEKVQVPASEISNETPSHLPAIDGEGAQGIHSVMHVDDKPHSGVSDPQYFEHTQILSQQVFPFITISADGAPPLIYKLEGSNWLVGRDKNLTISYENQKLSRRHFELKFDNDQYFVRDLGSSNGTTLNGDSLKAQEWTEIQSGDRLGVVDIVFEFEVRDAGFEDRMSQVPAEIRDDRALFEPPQQHLGAISFEAQEQIQPAEVLKNARALKNKINWVRVAIGLVLVMGLGLYLTDDGTQSPKTANPKKSEAASAFDKLPPDKKQYVKDTYRMADRLFKEGRYEMARQEVAKIHQLIPQYEESLQIEKLAAVAIQTQIDQRKAEEAERERIEADRKIKQAVVGCKKLISSKIEMRVIDDCLNPVIVLNPDHPDILELKNEVENIVAKRAADKARAEEYNALVKKRMELYTKAVELQKQEKPLEAIEAFTLVVNSKLPDPKNLTSKAQREIASIQQEIQKKTSEYEKSADEQMKSGNLKLAVQALQSALKVNPENEVIKGRLNSMISELKKQMQILYQEGVLEESVGEIETAKAKWKKIIDLSIPEEDYYKKSKIKLKKYEAG